METERYKEPSIRNAFEKTEAVLTQDRGDYGNINLSSILTRLIQEAGRFCERFASDLFIDAKSIERLTGTGNAGTEEKKRGAAEILEEMRRSGKEEECFYLALGMRKDGVDHNDYILSTMRQHEKDPWYLDMYYRRLFVLCIRRHISYSSLCVECTLKEVYGNMRLDERDRDAG